uniref:NIDO domain-containing protein n=1 Tax=Amphimedon queenslandica TaxID=400682 RepID=A0A1X7U2M9_AMPQE
MMIVFVIFIYFNGLLVSSEGNYLPFLNPTDYSTIRNKDDYATNVSLPSPLQFGLSCYTDAWISTNGLISLGRSYTGISPPHLFPISIPIIAPYWNDNDLNGGRGEVRYAVITPTTNLSLCNQVNDYLSNSTGSSVSVEWILWAYWKDVCPYSNNNCDNIQSNHYQVVLAFQSNATYAVFIYKCGLINWTRNDAGVGINSGDGYYINHPLSLTNNVNNIDCYDVVSGWANIVYRLDQVIDKFEFLSITPHSIIVSWEMNIPNNNSILILSITDSYQTVNNIINVTEYNNKYNYTEDLSLCNVYTFKLELFNSSCNDSFKVISTALTPKPENVSALYFKNETLVIRFQIHQCFNNDIQLLLAGANSFNTTDPMDIDSLQYIDEFYIVHWNIKLNRNSLYYLTVSAIGTYGTSSSDLTEISRYNVKDIMIKRSEGIVCFVCVTEMFNECQVMIASVATTLIPQSTQTNGTCYSFTDNGTYTVYAHDIENGLIILTPAVVIQYTVDWIEPSDTENTVDGSESSGKVSIGQSLIINIVLGSLLGLTTCAVFILIVIIILKKRGKTRSENFMQPRTQQETVEIPVTIKENPFYEMMSDEVPNTTNNYYSTSTSSNVDMIYEIPETGPQVSSHPYRVGYY